MSYKVMLCLMASIGVHAGSIDDNHYGRYAGLDASGDECLVEVKDNWVHDNETVLLEHYNLKKTAIDEPKVRTVYEYRTNTIVDHMRGIVSALPEFGDKRLQLHVYLSESGAPKRVDILKDGLKVEKCTLVSSGQISRDSMRLTYYSSQR
ncbi:MAG: hypothetical protein AB8E15_13490 [Bdellovibrionales bacterium]